MEFTESRSTDSSNNSKKEKVQEIVGSKAACVPFGLVVMEGVERLVMQSDPSGPRMA